MIALSKPYQLAIKAAVDASFVLMEYYTKGFHQENKSDGSPVTDADKASSDLIHRQLAKTNIPIIGEEIKNDSFEIRKHWKENWCVDPLDGTKEFIIKNGEFAVNIAHIVNNVPVFGIIVAPVTKEIIIGGLSMGVFQSAFDCDGTIKEWNEIKSKNEINPPLSLIASRSFHTPCVDQYVEKLELDYGKVLFHQKGSALKFFDLANETAHIYIRFAPTMEWDIAAGQAILEALGGEICAHDTNLPLTYNKESLENPHFLAKTASFLKFESLNR